MKSKAIEKQVIRKYPDGKFVYDFNPTDGYDDSSDVNEKYRVVPRQKGLTIDTAMAKAEKQPESLTVKCQYRTFVPCVSCSNCVIVREMENGELVNTAYACKQLKRMVDRYGTCIFGNYGKNGPFVIQRDKTMEEIESRKGELVN